MKKIIFFLSFLIILASCGSDDDICLNSESTPRLQIRFKNGAGQITRVENLIVDVDYGNGKPKNIITQTNVELVLVPLRIDDNPYTDIYFKTAKDGDSSKVRISYEKKAIYVSPACGFKVNYDDLKADLIKSDPVKNIESNETSLTDEGKVNFYLHF